jgi:hypothetical protein
MHPFVDAIRAAAEAAALPVVGSAAVATYDAAVPPRGRLGVRHPGARGVVVLAQGGGGFWVRFRAARSASWLARADDPLDAWTRVVVAGVVAAAQSVAPLPVRLVFPSDAAVDFRRLGLLAGLGVPSRLGLLMHPEFGTWLALRAAVLVPVALPPSRGLGDFAPCDACRDRPCEPACPVGAVSARGWDVPACRAHRRLPDETCGAGCHARLACPVGAAHRYPEDALRFHQAAARRLMAPGPR